MQVRRRRAELEHLTGSENAPPVIPGLRPGVGQKINHRREGDWIRVVAIVDQREARGELQQLAPHFADFDIAQNVRGLSRADSPDARGGQRGESVFDAVAPGKRERQPCAFAGGHKVEFGAGGAMVQNLFRAKLRR